METNSIVVLASKRIAGTLHKRGSTDSLLTGRKPARRRAEESKFPVHI